MLSLLLACVAEPPVVHPLPSAVAVVADTSRERIAYVDMADRSLLYGVPLRALHPDDCGPEFGGTAPEGAHCFPFQVDPELVEDDSGRHDELVLSYDRQAPDDAFERAAIERLRLHPDADPEVRWRLDSLDFTVNYGDRNDLCANTTPCQPGSDDPDAVTGVGLLCRLAHSHDFDVLAEDDDSVDLLVADTSNERVLRVHLDKATTCGVVEDVMSAATLPEWAAGGTPNDVDAVPMDDGSTGVLVTFRSSFADAISGGDDGHGLVMFFTQDATSWTHAWTFPSTGFLNSPHDTSVIQSPAGLRYLVGAHSDGNGLGLQEDWTLKDDALGSITVALLPDLASPPDYRYDVVLPADDSDPGIGFLRSALPYTPGVNGPVTTAGIDWILADSGCMSEAAGCPRTPGVRALQFDLDDPEDGTGTGAFEAGRGEQTFVEATANGDRLDCGFLVPYVADLLWETADALPATGGLCEP